MMVRAIIHKALTMTCEKLEFQGHLYEIPCMPFERLEKVIQKTFKRNVSVSEQKGQNQWLKVCIQTKCLVYVFWSQF